MQYKTFIHQLHAILQHPELQYWIRWNEEGGGDTDAFLIRPHDSGFAAGVLRRFFKHGKVSSFVRQLHMYGFHKLATETEGAEDKTCVVWKFAHPSGAFHRNSSVVELNRIVRKNGGAGKNGKRKNVLSPVCINYVGAPLPSLKPLPDEVPQSPPSPLLYPSRHNSQPSVEAPLPQLASSFPLAAASNTQVQHFQTNLNLMQKSLVTVLEVLQHFPSGSAAKAESVSATLLALKNEISCLDTKWTFLKHPTLSTHSSFSSVGSSSFSHPSGPPPTSRISSLSTQKSSIFSTVLGNSRNARMDGFKHC
ncbi:LAME_0B07536g1_1 [Lachancea meyersii CBS 8951]|uniref:LAME_0B07536g1_1 n=1 Tax=Lachancea meyersii CBS 8951 TaxID=1266667 RepID=A0A1G4IWN6_9SACH|nr:LAME_0B07536g1_1 [Lachancea meyersii CBS 8951]